jgi:hypothetical protein
MEEGDIVDVVAGSAANEAVLRKQAERGNYQCPFHGCFFPGFRGALHTACPLVEHSTGEGQFRSNENHFTAVGTLSGLVGFTQMPT